MSLDCYLAMRTLETSEAASKMATTTEHLPTGIPGEEENQRQVLAEPCSQNAPPHICPLPSSESQGPSTGPSGVLQMFTSLFLMENGWKLIIF